MQPSTSNIALLIDADNAPASKIKAILSEIAKYGVANIRRAYGDWKSPALKSWEACLHEYAIHPVQQFAYTKGKNATDAALIIDAMDLLYTQKLDGFAIVSSDCDFTPLVMRVLTNGLKAYGFGEKKTPTPFIHACSTFLYLESIEQIAQADKSAKSAAPKSTVGVRKTGKELKQDTKLMALLRSAVANTQDSAQWSSLAAIGTHIRKAQSSFNISTYGYANLSSLFKAIDSFEMHQKDKGLYVRIKQANKSAKK
jgi:uncharacterized LabA/DUF88 family protein